MTYLKNKISSLFFSSKINLRNTDIVIAEFPKSGITYITNIINEIRLSISDIKITSNYYNTELFVYDMDVSDNVPDQSNIFPYNIRFIKTHKYPPKGNRHAIYILRNPAHVMRSYYLFLNNNNVIDRNTLSFSDFIRSSTYGIKSWSKHYLDWMNFKGKLHIIIYENVIENPYEEISILLKNIGWKINDKVIKNAIKHSDIKNMQVMDQLYRTRCPSRNYNFINSSSKFIIDRDDLAYIKKETKQTIQKYELPISKNNLKFYF